MTELRLIDRRADHAVNTDALGQLKSQLDDRKEPNALVAQLDQLVRETGTGIDALSSALIEAEASGLSTQSVSEEAKGLWKDYEMSLKHLLSPGSGGHTLAPDAVDAVLSVALQATPRLNKALDRLSSLIRVRLNQQTRKLRVMQGVGIATTLLVFVMIVFHFLKNLGAEEGALEQARRETEQILSTVNEGLFLLDEDMTIGSEFSTALIDILRQEDFEGMSFSELLENIVPEKTLTVAMDFVSLLWGDRVNENLIKDLNPLSEVEVHFQDDAGIFDTRYLAFDFNRVKVDGQLSHILVTVTDITDRVQLARELEESQAQSQAQLDLLVSILHVDPTLLSAFLDDAEVAMQLVNTILKKPARDKAGFRTKLGDIFRQVHVVKGEAAALGLSTIEVKSHSFEDSLQELRERDVLTGNDFLPLAVKLDDFLSHLASVRDLISRLSGLRSAVGEDFTSASLIPAESNGSQRDDSSATDSNVAESTSALLQHSLSHLASRIAGQQGKQVQIASKGLEVIPRRYQKLVKDIALQLLRNSVVHGIETPNERAMVGKAPRGEIALRFQRNRNGGFQFEYRDDGRGLSADQIRVTAIRNGVISAEEACSMEDRQVVALIFKSGFSTSESVGKDSGRGVGMNIVKELVDKAGGRLKVSSKPGRMTAILVSLPATENLVAA